MLELSRLEDDSRRFQGSCFRGFRWWGLTQKELLLRSYFGLELWIGGLMATSARASETQSRWN